MIWGTGAPINWPNVSTGTRDKARHRVGYSVWRGRVLGVCVCVGGGGGVKGERVQLRRGGMGGFQIILVE